MRYLLCLMACTAFLLLTGCKPKGPETTTLPPVNVPSTVGLITVAVHLPDAEPRVWEVEALAQTSVWELMTSMKTAEFAFTDTLYPGMGHMVTSVAGIRNANGSGAYWQFCIDNEASDRGVDEKTVGPGQKLDWHYSKYGELPCKKIGE